MVKKFTKLLLASFLLLALSFSFLSYMPKVAAAPIGQTEPPVGGTGAPAGASTSATGGGEGEGGGEGAAKCEKIEQLPDAANTMECGAAHCKRPPKNCHFLEEPIGGRPNRDLYTVECTGEKCAYVIWGGGGISPNARGPIQAIITYDAGKQYQGPFGLLYGYLGLIYGYMSGLIVGMVVLFIVIGGIQMTTSGGDQAKFDAGKSRIIRALIGMVLWFTASLILYTINPTFFAF